MRTNGRQRWVLGVAIAATAGMLLTPPWLYRIGELNESVGYGLVFSPPKGRRGRANTINWGQLAVQLGGVWVLAGGGFALLGGSSRKASGSETGS